MNSCEGRDWFRNPALDFLPPHLFLLQDQRIDQAREPENSHQGIEQGERIKIKHGADPESAISPGGHFSRLFGVRTMASFEKTRNGTRPVACPNSGAAHGFACCVFRKPVKIQGIVTILSVIW